jgi:hypothetical protein
LFTGYSADDVLVSAANISITFRVFLGEKRRLGKRGWLTHACECQTREPVDRYVIVSMAFFDKSKVINGNKQILDFDKSLI